MATFVLSTRIQRILKTLSYWYASDSSRLVLSDEYPYARVSVQSFFFDNFVLAKFEAAAKGT